MKTSIKLSCCILTLLSFSFVASSCQNSSNRSNDEQTVPNLFAKEPEAVITPPSMQEEKDYPGNVTVYIAEVKDADDNAVDAKAFIEIEMTDDCAECEGFDNANFRRKLLTDVLQRYNSLSDKNISLTDEQIEEFANTNVIGVPIKYLPEFLSEKMSTRDQWLTNMQTGGKYFEKNGIPYKKPISAKEDITEFDLWVTSIASVAEPCDTLYQLLTSGIGLQIKTDQDIPYKFVQPVLERMRDNGLNKFIIVTSLKPDAE